MRLLLLASCVVLLAGCQDLVQWVEDTVAFLMMLLVIALGLGLLALLGTLGMTVSAFRNKAPEMRLALSTLLAGISVAAAVTTVLKLDTAGFIEFGLALIPTPAILWALITWGELFDMRRSLGGAPSTTYRSLALVGALFYVAALLGLTWHDHGQPTWEEMFPPPTGDAAREMTPIGEPIEELHTRGRSPVALTKSGRMLVLEGTRASIHPGVYTAIVTADEGAICGVTAEGEVSCVELLRFEAVQGKVDALALSNGALCRTPRGQKLIECDAPESKGKPVTIPNTRDVSALALDQKRLFVLGKDQVVLEFDTGTGQPGPLHLDKIASMFAGGDVVCFIGVAGDVRCQNRGELRAIELPFAATAGAVADYVGCATDATGKLACWDEFSRSDKSKSVTVDGTVQALWPGNTFYVNVKLGSDRFIKVDNDLETDPISLPVDVFTP